MSNIYIQEPPTNGKVCLKTTVGDIEIELWSKECPKACRNFVQLSMEHYYDGTIFHRVVPGFIVQGGDPTGSGYGGESCYGQTFKDEFHSRLRFVRRGLVAMANGGKPNDNGSQFFFTLDKAPELQNKHTIFGQVVGSTLFNMLRLGECEVDKNERPENPQKIISVLIVVNPFPDIVPRIIDQKTKPSTSEAPEKQIKATKNYNLLSFGDEAEEDDELYSDINKSLASKSKSVFDNNQPTKRKTSVGFDAESETEIETEISEKSSATDALSKIKEKLKLARKEKGVSEKRLKTDNTEEVDMDLLISEEKSAETKAKLNALKNEYKELKSELRKNTQEADADRSSKTQKAINPDVQRFIEERKKYKETEIAPRKSMQREQDIRSALEKFREKLRNVRQSAMNNDNQNENGEREKIINAGGASLDEDEIEESSWLPNVFAVPKETVVVKEAKDANVKNEDMFDIYDPRNPINRRRRQQKSSRKEDKNKH